MRLYVQVPLMMLHHPARCVDEVAVKLLYPRIETAAHRRHTQSFESAAGGHHALAPLVIEG